MSKRNPNNTLLYGILTALIVGCAVALGFLEWGHNLPEAQAHDYESSRYAESANRRIDSICVGLNGASLAECIIEIEQSERGNYRAEQDLYAQSYMMVWAFFMVAVSVIATGVTAVGIYLVYQTLVETREAVAAANKTADITREIGEAQVSAHLMPKTFSVSLGTIESGGKTSRYFAAKILIQNAGTTPAYRISVAGLAGGLGKKEWSPVKPPDFGPNDKLTATFEMFIDPKLIDEAHCRIQVYIKYDTVFTRGVDNVRMKQIRFDYNATRQNSGNYVVERV